MTHNSRVDARQRPQQSSALRAHYYGEKIQPMKVDRPSFFARLLGAKA